MQLNNSDLAKKSCHDEPGDARSGIALPRQIRSQLFAGWGPKLIAVALVANMFASATPVKAASTSAAPTCSAQDHGASIVQNPIPVMPAIAEAEGAGGEVVLRIDLSSTGLIENVAIVRSSDNMYLDREAMNVTHEARFAPALSQCTPVPESVLYTVSFVP